MAALPPHSERQALFNLIEMHLWTVAVHHPSCFGISESGHEMDLNFFFLCTVSHAPALWSTRTFAVDVCLSDAEK
jgi:hypothetical protein